MPSLELKTFQSASAKLIADRYAFFARHPDRPRRGPKPRPFFQALSALTGAGKTPMLAQAVELMRTHVSAEPIVLWMSKARSVVAQTYTNFDNGKYSEIVEGFRTIGMASISPALIEDGATPLLVLTTTGLFNNRDQSEGSLNIYKKGNDGFGDTSPWGRLIERSHDGKRRPLWVVYDEGHNLSEQQTEILAELEPDAYLLASATLKLPANFQKSVIQPVKLWVEESDEVTEFARLNAVDATGTPEAERFVTTAVDSVKVVEAELVKKAILFEGTTAAMESALDALFDRRELLLAEITARGLAFQPKTIYVCKTNIADDGELDDATRPFALRNAPPIRIWRYLVEQKRVPPEQIAIYANLVFPGGTKPSEVNLFSKGERDFDDFTAGSFQHVIFNLSLQEGWDDPECYLAYIDKSMGSSIQVEQIIGRVLRQYGATHYESSLLNSAHFFLRVDKESVFTESIDKVRSKLQSEGAPIEIAAAFAAKGGGAIDVFPSADAGVEIHHVFVDSEAARDRIAELVGKFPSFVEGDANTIGEAHTAKQIVDLESLGSGGAAADWFAEGRPNPVRLRWLVTTAIRARSARTLSVVDLQLPKFDVRVQAQSVADDQAQQLAANIVSAYFHLSELVYESDNPFLFGAMRVPKNAPSFRNGLYDRYIGFNPFELAFANAVDGRAVRWHRNPSNGGFFIPLLSEGDTASFYPDFIIWHDGKIFCVDTKGSHLLSDAVARKLFDIAEDGRTKLHVRFITEGRQAQIRGTVTRGGFTVWKIRSNAPVPIHTDTLQDAIAESLR